MGEIKPTILTGDRPTGRLHLGHFIGSIENRLKLQEESNLLLMVADVQALTDNADNPEKVRQSVFDVTVDNLACGVDPEKTTIFIQSQVTALGLLTELFMNLVTLAQLERNPTVKTEMKEKGFGRDVPVGFLAYPISQAADILGFKTTVVPVGEDQLPMIEQANDIANRFNNYYPAEPPVFAKVKGVLPEGKSARLPGIDGKAKMGKSLGNALYLSDSEEETEKKVMAMYTDPDHLKVEDPGKVEGNVVFAYLDAFDDNKDEVAKLKEHYQKGGLGDVEIKKRLIEVLNTKLAPMRERRKELEKDPEKIYKILEEGTKKANDVAEGVLAEVRDAMKINYFR